jgi:hypothetical protein
MDPSTPLWEARGVIVICEGRAIKKRLKRANHAHFGFHGSGLDPTTLRNFNHWSGTRDEFGRI